MWSLIILYVFIFVSDLSAMNSEQRSRTPLFKSASSGASSSEEDDAPVDLHTLPSLSVHHENIQCLVRDSKRALHGIKASSDMQLECLDNAPSKGELYRLKMVGNKYDVMQITTSRDSLDQGTKIVTLADRTYEWGFISADGKIVVGITPAQDLEIYNVVKKAITKKTCGPGQIQAGMVSPDRTCIALSIVKSQGSELRLIPVVVQDVSFSSQTYSRALDFSHDSQYVAALSGVYSVKEKKLVWQQHVDRNAWSSAAFNGDGTLLAVGHRNNTSTVFDAKNGIRLYELWQGGEQAFFSQDNKHLATRGAHGVRIWKLAVLKKIYDTFSAQEREDLNNKLDTCAYGDCPPEFRILHQIDRAMQHGSQVRYAYDIESKLQLLPLPLQRAFAKHIIANTVSRDEQSRKQF